MSVELLEKIRILWERYIEYGELSDDVSLIVRDSWIRCRNLGVDPYGGVGSKISDKEFHKVLSNSQELIEVAKPIMENLHNLVIGTGFILVLTDSRGVVVHLLGDKNIKEDASLLNFQPGYIWDERAVGTNAIGTSLIEFKPVQTIGAEHYCQGHHSWTCSAAPIRGDDGEIIGVLDMSGHSLDAHKHTLGTVVAAAFSIERELSLRKYYAVLNTAVESIADGMIIVDERYFITRINKSGSRILGAGENELEGLDVREILGSDIFIGEDIYRDRVDWHFLVNNKRIPCIIKIKPIRIDMQEKGMVILFNEMKDVQKTVNAVLGNKATYYFDSILTENPTMQEAIRYAKIFAKTSGCILIEGESGTGKELFAHAIHNHSRRREGPFVAINCASIPKDLVESELFGYEKGAFTGAIKTGKVGKFELAKGGTIFLDEIGELPINLQAKILRVLDDYTITRVGGKYPIKLDVRVIVATNRNLLKETQSSNFRKDLYYRLNLFNVKIPPLRNRGKDVNILAEHFVNRLNGTQNRQVKMSPEFLLKIKSKKWEGNVRELENAIYRAYYLCQDNIINVELLQDDILAEEKKTEIETETETETETRKIVSLDEQEKDIIERTLGQTKGHVEEAAHMMGLSRSSLYRKIKKHNINPREYRL